MSTTTKISTTYDTDAHEHHDHPEQERPADDDYYYGDDYYYEGQYSSSDDYYFGKGKGKFRRPFRKGKGKGKGKFHRPFRKGKGKGEREALSLFGKGDKGKGKGNGKFGKSKYKSMVSTAVGKSSGMLGCSSCGSSNHNAADCLWQPGQARPALPILRSPPPKKFHHHHRQRLPPGNNKRHDPTP